MGSFVVDFVSHLDLFWLDFRGIRQLHSHLYNCKTFHVYAIVVLLSSKAMVSEGFLKLTFVRATVVAKSAFRQEHLFVSLSVA